MLKLFLDANVLISMVLSKVGASRELFAQAQKDPARLHLYINDYAKEEARDVLTRNGKHDLRAQLDTLLKHRIWHEVTTTTQEDDEAAAALSDPDDAQILAAAKKLGADALVSFDRKHLHTPEVARYLGAPVITAGDALALYRSQR